MKANSILIILVVLVAGCNQDKEQLSVLTAENNQLSTKYEDQLLVNRHWWQATR